MFSFLIKYLFQQQWTTRTKNDTSERHDVSNRELFNYEKKEGGAKTLSVSWYVLSPSLSCPNRFLEWFIISIN